jgi:hypothetical protein
MFPVAVALVSATAVAQFELDLTDEKKPAQDKSKSQPVDELDFSTTANVKQVVVLPPIVRVTQSQGGFSGFDNKKSFDKFDLSAHKRLVAALQKQLEGKVLPAEATQAAMTKEGITVAMVRSGVGVAKMAAALSASLVVVSELSKTGAMSATIVDVEGKQIGEPTVVSNAAGLTQKTADECASALSRALVEASKPKVVEAPVAAAAAPAHPEEDVQDSPPSEVVSEVSKGWQADPEKTRVVVAVGGGGAFRDLSVSGAGAAQLAQLRNNGVVGVGLYAQVRPLQFIPSLQGGRFSDLELEVNFRRAFVRAIGTEGDVQGQSCSMTDDDLQVRGTYRVRVTNGAYSPWVGLGAGWSQERTVFESCRFPVVSAAYRGFDAQLRVRQPLYKKILSLDAAFGPRILQGDGTTTTRLSMSGEAWLELKPFSIVFVRGGARASRLLADLPNVALAENRIFFALEAGAFF